MTYLNIFDVLYTQVFVLKCYYVLLFWRVNSWTSGFGLGFFRWLDSDESCLALYACVKQRKPIHVSTGDVDMSGPYDTCVSSPDTKIFTQGMWHMDEDNTTIWL